MRRLIVELIRTYEFVSILVHGEMDGTEATTTNLLLYHVLIDPVHGRTVIVAAAVVCARIERFLDSSAA